MKNQINLLWLYPDLLNLHGDRGNIMAFEKIAEKLGLKLNIIKVENLDTPIPFEDVDIVFLNPGELKVCLRILDEFISEKAKIEEYLNNEKYLIAIGTTGAIFGKQIIRTNGELYYALDLIDMKASERKSVIGDDVYFSIGEEEIIGSQIQMLDFEVSQENILGRVMYGYGNNGDKLEGARSKNLIFTNALGPVFVKNPWWAEEILTDIAVKKGYEINEIALENYEIEVKSFNSTKKFIENKLENK